MLTPRQAEIKEEFRKALVFNMVGAFDGAFEELGIIEIVFFIFFFYGIIIQFLLILLFIFCILLFLATLLLSLTHVFLFD